MRVLRARCLLMPYARSTGVLFQCAHAARQHAAARARFIAMFSAAAALPSMLTHIYAPGAAFRRCPRCVVAVMPPAMLAFLAQQFSSYGCSACRCCRVVCALLTLCSLTCRNACRMQQKAVRHAVLRAAFATPPLYNSSRLP